METNETMEQPVLYAVKVDEPIIENKDEATETGSNLGKFKDAKSLYSAYVNLEKEFTRKSQKLAELCKNQTEEKTQNDNSNDENQRQNSENQQDFDKNNIVPEYLKSSWRSTVNSFLFKNPEAKNYLKSISSILLENKELSTYKECLPIAFELAKAKERPANLNDPKLKEVVLNDENIKNQIIKEYLLSLKNNQSKFKLMDGEASNTMLTPIVSKPKTLKEANDMFKRLLQS